MSALKILCALLLTCGFAGSAAAAQTSSAPASPPADQNAQPATQPPAGHVGQRLREDLSKAGFTDIKIMPSSFLVRAKDSQGNPVMMVINPDSVTEVTEQSNPSAVTGAMKGAANSQVPSPAPATKQ
jgi:hypothetical protein